MSHDRAARKPRSRQHELERLGRALRTLGGSNRALLRATDEASLLREVCRVVVEEAGYRYALVGRAEHDEDRTVTVLAQHSVEDLPELPPLTWADTERGRGATGMAIRTGLPCVVNNVLTDPYPVVWREVLRRRGAAAVLALPLRVDGAVFGALAIAAPEPDAFGEKELEVLKEAADDLAFGLETLCLRQRRLRAEAEVLRLNRALRARAAVNCALAHASDETELLEQICRIAVDDCGYRLAWVGYIEDDEARTIRPMAHAGFEDGFLALPRSWRGPEQSHRMRELVEAGQAVVFRDAVDDAEYPFREEARRRGYASVIVLPLRIESQWVGSLHILAAETDAFDEQEVKLLMDTAGDLGYGLGTLRARARAAAAEETIRRMAYFDALTGLPNRVRLRDLLAEELQCAKAERRPLALLRVEMERFRDINETLGGVEVDELLCRIAARLVRTAGEAASVARLAECEFAVILPRSGAEQATALAQRILAALYEPIELSGLLLDARSSVGVSLFPGHGTDGDALLRRAGIALDQARASGSPIALFRADSTASAPTACR